MIHKLKGAKLLDQLYTFAIGDCGHVCVSNHKKYLDFLQLLKSSAYLALKQTLCHKNHDMVETFFYTYRFT